MANLVPGQACPTCRHFACVCTFNKEHASDCKFRRAATGPVGIACDHGRDVCPTCDPCTCGAGGFYGRHVKNEDNMKSDAERRISLVNTMNGVMANIKTAEARDTAADARLASAQESLDNIKTEHEQRQAAMRAKYKELHGALDSLDTPEARTEAMTAINDVLSSLETDREEQASRTKTATAAFNNAKSEKGTATRELAKLREELAQHQTSLNKLLPSPESLGA